MNLFCMSSSSEMCPLLVLIWRVSIQTTCNTELDATPAWIRVTFVNVIAQTVMQTMEPS